MKKTKTKLLAFLLSVVLALCALAMLTACDNGVAFTGSGEINGVTYNVTLKCGKDDTFALTIKELPELELDGTYEYDDSKGYRFTFSDQNDTVKVPKFDEATSTFSFTYKLILGDRYGTGNVTLSYVDKNFTPGEALFFEPVTFYAYDPDVGNYGMTSCEAYLYLYEDGTFMIIGSCPLTAVNAASGTYTYDAEANKYVFEYDSSIGTEMGNLNVSRSDTEAVYNPETDAYEMTIYYNLGLTSTLNLSTNF